VQNLAGAQIDALQHVVEEEEHHYTHIEAVQLHYFHREKQKIQPENEDNISAAEMPERVMLQIK
jgi:hypothetical protein